MSELTTYDPRTSAYLEKKDFHAKYPQVPTAPGEKRRHSEYEHWHEMHRACRLKSAYTDKGIRVCPRWGSFDQFFSDMGAAPEGHFQLRRKDTQSDFSPENCFWKPISLLKTGEERPKKPQIIREQGEKPKKSHVLRSWENMIRSCETSPLFVNNGITVCDRWKESFEAFCADLGEVPEGDYRLYREDVSKGYTPENTSWLPTMKTPPTPEIIAARIAKGMPADKATNTPIVVRRDGSPIRLTPLEWEAATLPQGAN